MLKPVYEYIGHNSTPGRRELPAQNASLTTMRCVVILCIALTLTGCVRRAGRNIDCYWPGESPLSNPMSDI